MGELQQESLVSLPDSVNDTKTHFHDSRDFQELRSRYRRFVFPVTLGALVWYMLYVVCSVYAPRSMDREVFGEISLAFLFGLSQFVMTFAITYLYSRHAERRLEPLAHKIRMDMLDADQ